MKAGELIDKMEPSDRVIISTRDGQDLFRGFVGVYKEIRKRDEYKGIDEAEVDKHKLSTDIFRKQNREQLLLHAEHKVSKVDWITDMEFVDLEILIYTKIILQKNS